MVEAYAEAGSVAGGGDGRVAAGAAGLVPLSTSQTLLEVDAYGLRLEGMRRTVLNTARVIRDALEEVGAGFRMAMVTLTYRVAGEWKPKHVSAFLDSVRKYLRRRGLAARYVWVAELQERGAVHYHLLFFLPKGLTLPKPDKQGWWRHGTTRVEWVRKPIGYLTKYVSKLQQKTVAFPKGLRICGTGGLDADGRRECRWWKFPSYVRDYWLPHDDVARAHGGGFLSRATGEHLPARYRFVRFHQGSVWLLDTWASRDFRVRGLPVSDMAVDA